jgi:iron complex outermembrane receptor protein
MREVPSRTAAAGADRGLWLRGGAVTFLVGAAFGFDSPAARAQESPTPSATSQPAAAPATAPAAETPPASRSDNQYEEIVVTARKRSESLHDIPASVQTISGTAIKETHLTQLDDIGSMASNVNIFEAHDNSPAVTLRGIGAFELVQGVGFYLNDVQLFEGQTVRPNDIDRIEILKGPQGTLYGGANIGGAIKYITKDPTPTWENEATAELGNYKTRNVEAIISGPIADKLGVRASLYDDNHGGYIWDTYHHETIGASHDRGGRLVLLAEPKTTTNVRLAFNFDDYDSQNQNLQYRVTEVGNATQPYTADAYRYSVDDYFIPSFIRKLYSTTLDVDHQFANGVSLTSITSQFWSYNRGITDLTKQPVPLDKLFQNYDHRVISQELRLASTTHWNLDWLVGAFVQRHKTDTNVDDNLYNGDPVNPIITGNDWDNQYKTQKQYALFGDTTYHLGDWAYEFGLRAEHYSSDLHARNDPGDGNGPRYLGPKELSGDNLSPRVSVQYKFSPATNIYATFARGYQPGDLVEQNLEIDSIRPETTTSYEVGLKSRLPHGIQFTAAAYLMDYKDRLYQTFRAIPGAFQDVTTNIGPSRNSGVEMDFLVPLSSEFKLNGGFGTTRAKWGNIRYADPQLTGISGSATPIYSNLNGLTAPFTPAYSANLALEWNHKLGSGVRVGARVDGSAIGQSYWDPNDFARQKAYQLMNLGAHFDSTHWTLIGRITNVTGTRFNTMYWDSWDVGGIPHSFARINRPRTFVLSGTYRL